MAEQAELGSIDSAALWASRTSSWWVGWIVPVGTSCNYRYVVAHQIGFTAYWTVFTFYHALLIGF